MLKQDGKPVHTMDPIHTYSPDDNAVPSATITENLASSLHHTGTCPSGFLLEIPAEGPNPSCSQVGGARSRLSTNRSGVVIPPIPFPPRRDFHFSKGSKCCSSLSSPQHQCHAQHAGETWLSPLGWGRGSSPLLNPRFSPQ